MTLFLYIGQNLERIRFDIRCGIISCAILKHYRVYSRYDYYKRLGNSTSDAVIYTCNDYQVSQRWVFTIIKKMEAEV
jgi:hypothetical protein